jgi:hypothetical protein
MTDSTSFNNNPANNNNFLVRIAGAGITVDYWARSVTLPTLSMPGADMAYQNKQFSMPSNTSMKDELTIEFMLEEKLKNYIYFRRWAKKGLYGEGPINDCLLDMSIFFLDSNKQPAEELKYKGCFPTNISGLTLEHGVIDVIPNTFNVNFQFMEEVFGSQGGDPWGNGRE